MLIKNVLTKQCCLNKALYIAGGRMEYVAGAEKGSRSLLSPYSCAYHNFPLMGLVSHHHMPSTELILFHDPIRLFIIMVLYSVKILFLASFPGYSHIQTWSLAVYLYIGANSAIVQWASPLPHGGKGLVNWVFNCCPQWTGQCAPIRGPHSVMWYVATPNTRLTRSTKCEIDNDVDCHSGSVENCSL